MALTPFSLLLRRRFTSYISRPYIYSFFLKPFSTTSLPNPNLSTTTSSSAADPTPSNLSARLSFVFDQIDAIDRERAQKDQTLQRIRAWRESKNQKKPTHEDETSKFRSSDSAELTQSRKGESLRSEEEGRVRNGLGSDLSYSEVGQSKKEEGVSGLLKKVELVHPWPEWIELMERLVQQNYFDHKRKDEDKMVQDLGFDMSEVFEEGFDFTRDWKTVQTACLNFGRDRFDILRSLSRQDIQILVGYGCPSTDKKVVFSAKLLRKHVHLDEGDVCSSCSLRSSCEKAFLQTNKEDEARTIDVMRVLLTYGFDPVNGSVTNKSLLKQKSVKNVVRKLLHEVVKLSAVPIDPNLPPPVFKKPPPKVKQPPPPPKKRVGRDDIEMKKGDWLCPKCDFMNFAKNTICLQCDAKRPKRQLLPGEWECPECNFLNYRRNMACFHCECKRPPDEYMENQTQERQRGPRTRFEKVASKGEVSNAWNFDFDDDESDGADVAAFEYADAPRLGEDFPLDVRDQVGNIRGSADNFVKAKRTPSTPSEPYSDANSERPGTGFDDFDDEEDDIDSYEIDTRNTSIQKPSSRNFSDIEQFSETEDIGDSDRYRDRLHRHEASSSSYGKSPKTMRRRAAFSGSEDELDSDSGDELSVHPNWKSSHVANSKQNRGGSVNSQSRRLSFDSDKELGLISGSEDELDYDIRSKKSKLDRRHSNQRNFSREVSDIDDDFSGPESDDDDRRSPRTRSRGNRAGPNWGGNNSKGRDRFDFARDSTYRAHGMKGDGRNSFNGNLGRSSRGSRNDHGGYHGDGRSSRGSRNDHGGYQGDGRSSRGSRNDHRGYKGDDYGRHRRNERGSDFRDFSGPRRGEGYGNQKRGRFNDKDKSFDMDRNFGDDRPRRVRIIER